MLKKDLKNESTEPKSKVKYKKAKKEIKGLVDFNKTKVEPLNFTRKNLLEDEDCLSYL
jgi:hypothetical protein